MDSLIILLWSNLIAIQFGYMSLIQLCLWNTDHQVLKQPFCILSKMLQLTPCLTVIIPSPETIGTEKLTSVRFFIPPFSYYLSCWRIASIIVNRYLNTIISISTENVIFISSVQFSNAVCVQILIIFYVPMEAVYRKFYIATFLLDGCIEHCSQSTILDY